MKENYMKRLAKELEKYKQENVCEAASSQCKDCTFSINDNTGCSLNLVINSLENNLSIYKSEASNQYSKIIGFNK